MLDIVNDTKVNHIQSLPGEKSGFNETISKNQMAAPATGVHTQGIVLMSEEFLVSQELSGK